MSEGGWPGANPKDNEFFKRAKSDLNFTTATLTAFGSTRRPRASVEGDPPLHALLEAETEVICIVGKAWDYHVREALRAELEEGVAMVAESIEYLKRHDRRVFFDAEHFFDGYAANPEFSLNVLKAARDAGAERLVLCDTNGGRLPADIPPDSRRRSGRTCRCGPRRPFPQRCRMRRGVHSGGSGSGGTAGPGGASTDMANGPAMRTFRP